MPHFLAASLLLEGRSIRTEFVENIDKCIGTAVLSNGQPLALVVRVGMSPEGVFTLAYTKLFQKFGAPDYPTLEGGAEYTERLEISAPLVAVWDFDYHMLSLRIEGTGAERRVLLQQHDL